MPPKRRQPKDEDDLLPGRPANLEDITPDGNPDYDNAIRSIRASRDTPASVERMCNLFRDSYVDITATPSISPNTLYEVRVAYALTMKGGAKLFTRLARTLEVAQSQHRRARCGDNNLIGFRLLLDAALHRLAGPESATWPIQSEDEASAAIPVVDAPQRATKRRGKPKKGSWARRHWWVIAMLALAALAALFWLSNRPAPAS